MKQQIALLMSGGLDSSLMALIARNDGLDVLPVYVNYGQLATKREQLSLRRFCNRYRFPKPLVMDLSGFGKQVRSGLTDKQLDIVEDAFLPCRNLLFIVSAAALAYGRGCRVIGVGILREEDHLFPDQTRVFLDAASEAVSKALNVEFEVIAPLMHFSKKQVVKLAKAHKLGGTYSCHAGTLKPCGKCIACREYL